MLHQKKIRAFTIMELLVSMLISSVILSFAYGVYFFVYRYSDQIQLKAGKMNDLERVEYFMRNDHHQASSFIVDNGSITFGSRTDTIKYLLGGNCQRLRKAQHAIDTLDLNVSGSFWVQSEAMQFCFQSAELANCFVLDQLSSSFSLYPTKD